tara:strand:- start:7075 stop:7188 length:114 start_codon:yes stop_codon:yes gene_type:complete
MIQGEKTDSMDAQFYQRDHFFNNDLTDEASLAIGRQT